MRTLLCGALCSGFFGYAFHFLDFVHGGGCRFAFAVFVFALGICLFVPGDFTELADRNSGKEIAAKHLEFVRLWGYRFDGLVAALFHCSGKRLASRLVEFLFWRGMVRGNFDGRVPCPGCFSGASLVAVLFRNYSVAFCRFGFQRLQIHPAVV